MACQRLHLPAIPNAAHRAVQQGAQHRGLEWFLDIPECAGLDRRNDSFFAALAGNNDGGNGLQFVTELGEQVEPVHSGQLHVGNQDGGSKFGKTRQRVFRAAYAENLVAPPAQQSFVSNTRVLFILDDQDAVGRRLHGFKASGVSHSIYEQPRAYGGSVSL